MSDPTQTARLEYLKELYEPTPDCKEAGFKCDYRIDDETEECPCEWALSAERQKEITGQRELS